MTRRCSHCSNNGHNSRTCPSKSRTASGVKLFGVKLTDGSIIKKSASMGNLSAHYHSSSSAAASPNHPPSPSSDALPHSSLPLPDGYLSDDPAHPAYSSNRRSQRKKGNPWTEEEHRQFLIGLQRVGKGDWRGISRSFVTSRTPTQVASHAQKYFIRQTNTTRRKRRSSLFDMVPEMDDDDEEDDRVPIQEEKLLLHPESAAEENRNTDPSSSLKLSLDPEFEAMETTTSFDEKPEEQEELQETWAPPHDETNPSPVATFFPTAYLTIPVIPYPFWQSNMVQQQMKEENWVEIPQHEVLRPTAIIPTKPLNVDELVGLSQLSLSEAEPGHIEPSPLSLTLLSGASSGPSAFHPTSYRRHDGH